MADLKRKLWERIQRRAAKLEPAVANEILKAYERIVNAMPVAELARAIESGEVDALFDKLLKDQFTPVAEKIRQGVVDGTMAFGKDLPLPRGVTFGFNQLNPRVITAVRQLQHPVLEQLETNVRETVRAYVENGLRDGVAPRTIARDVRQYVGLGPTQLQEVDNYRKALEASSARAFNYTLRDKRFDSTVARAMAGEKTLTTEQIDKMTEAYLKRRIAQNAESVSRTVSLQSQKLSNRLSMDVAVDKGIYARGSLMKERIGVNDGKERPEHVALNGEKRLMDEPYSNGEMVSGDLSFNCRCVDRFYVSRDN